MKCDGTDEASLVAALKAACGANGPIRHAVNNVGAPRGSTVERTTLEDWQWGLRTKLTSAFLAMKHQIPILRAAAGGTIVNIASNTASVFTPYSPPGYAATKAAVINLTHYASIVHGADNIRINSVSPGLTATPLLLKTCRPRFSKRSWLTKFCRA